MEDHVPVVVDHAVATGTDGPDDGGPLTALSGALRTSLEGSLQTVVDTVARDARQMLDDATRHAEAVRAGADEYARATRSAADAALSDAARLTESLMERLRSVQSEVTAAEERRQHAMAQLREVMDQLLDVTSGIRPPAGHGSPDVPTDLEEDQIRRPW